MKIAVIGLGKMGLPFALQCATRSQSVIGCDANQALVHNLNNGVTELSGEPGVQHALDQTLASGHFRATTETQDAIRKSEVVVVLVPVYVDSEGTPDFSTIDNVAHQIATSLNKGTLVIFETTLPVGTTRKRFSAAIEKKSGLKAGLDFKIAFSPERVSSGSVLSDLRRYPKLVGGVNQESTKAAVDFYEKVLEFEDRPDLTKKNGVWALANSEAAELAKLAETTYRDVNIGLANQFAIYAETIGADIYEIIDACNTQPFSHIHQPGIAVGGHCIPVYPHMYLQGDPAAKVVRVAREINKSMPEHALKLIEEEIGPLRGKKIAILGLAYRAGVKEDAFSGTWDLVKGIASRGGFPLVHDPLYSVIEIEAKGLTPFVLGEYSDAAIFHTSHEPYQMLKLKDLPGLNVFIDGRNAAPEAITSRVKTIVLGKSN